MSVKNTDFFAKQENARKRKRILYLSFGLSITITILMVYLFAIIIIYPAQLLQGASHYEKFIFTPFRLWQPSIFLQVSISILMFIGIATYFRLQNLKQSADAYVTKRFHARRVALTTNDPSERRLLNIIEEMSIASGLPILPVYVMERQKGINAFTIGACPAQSIIVVTSGALRALTRDELQGVMAHEFSHVLNGDVSLNTLMAGILEGLLVIYETGEIITPSYSNTNELKTSLSIFAMGLVAQMVRMAAATLRLIGYAGVLCGHVIKSTTNRASERMADAAAVQFTRNPLGLAGALKKVGGLKEGSYILSPYSGEIGHMCFGNGEDVTAWLSTHPPLKERVKWLDPSFNGKFEPYTLPKATESQPEETNNTSVAGAALATALAAQDRPRFKPMNSNALINSIGRPQDENVDIARTLLDSIPEQLKSHAQDPCGARMLVYFMLLNSEETIRDQQMELIHSEAEPAVFNLLEQAVDSIDPIHPALRMPLIDLAVPTLKLLSREQYITFRKLVKKLTESDRQVDLFEYALLRILVYRLDPAFGAKPKRKPFNYYSMRGLEKATSTILSTIALYGHATEKAAESAFKNTVKHITKTGAGFEFLGIKECSWKNLNHALDQFEESSFKVKQWLLATTLACLMHDKKITVEEVELFRIIAITLDCPVPPWVAPTEES
ncbi:MAG TPA: M48 family metalloprotease [Pontiella sp.]